MVVLGTEGQGMESDGWRSWDLVAGGMLTAGLAFGAYKLGRSNLPCKDRHLGGTMVRSKNNVYVGAEWNSAASVAHVHDVETTRLRECMALALTGGSQMLVHIPPQQDAETQRLADSLHRSQQAIAETGPQGIPDRDRGDRTNPRATANARAGICNCVSPADAGPRGNPSRGRRRSQGSSAPCSLCRGTSGVQSSGQPCASPLRTPELETSPTEHAKQLQAYRQRLDKWVAESETKMNHLEQQRLALSTELQMTHEALARARQDLEAEEKNRRTAESRLKEVEESVQHGAVLEIKLLAKEEQVQQLERQCAELEEQWEKLFQENIITAREAARDNVQQQEELRLCVEQLETMLQEREKDIEEMENEIVNLSNELRKTKKDQRGLAEENARFQKEARMVRDMLQNLAGLMCSHWGHMDGGQHEMNDLAQVTRDELPLDKMLTRITAALTCVIAHNRHRQP